ncbi:response regulator transcription factor [Ruminiclostridium papyrosolvens DSM 2782]|uniref:response regulator transcription factor n=1 Tax=Ruminiclostridium papyrosolvens TaxID=29362 RepID=UPI0002FB02A2|nr:response regulator transcription factor [Ruminiclostridium papyrosolvens]WES33084.1 response regulator transcription factor [Ruminiclostridium papyrosolvens DSM 2782]
MAKILIVEDEKSISDELAILLQNAGYDTAVIEDFADTEAQIKKTMPDLVLLDIGLPGQDGYRICTELRKTSQIPVIFVTSRNTSMDELRALSLGGDDFISKPYDLPILLARIQALLRRSGQAEKDILTVNGLTLSLPNWEIEHNGQRADITKNEAKILSCLMKTPGKIVSRSDLIEYLWDNQVYIDDNTLSVNVTRLRGKLNNIGLPDYVKTKRGLGYKI